MGSYLAHPSVNILRPGYYCRTGCVQSTRMIIVPLDSLLTRILQQSTAQQEADAKHFLPVPGAPSGNGALHVLPSALQTTAALLILTFSTTLL